MHMNETDETHVYIYTLLYMCIYISETCVWSLHDVFLAKIAMEISAVQIQVETERGVYKNVAAELGKSWQV